MWLSSSRTGTCLRVPTAPLQRNTFKKKTNSRKVNYTPTQKTRKKTPGRLENIFMTFDLAVMIKEATECTDH